MKLGRLLLLAGAAVAANQFLNKTEKGRQLKKDIADNAGKWKEKITDAVNKTRSNHSDTLDDSNPTSSSYSGTGSPL